MPRTRRFPPWLTLGPDGNIYGPYQNTLFRITTAGSYSTFYTLPDLTQNGNGDSGECGAVITAASDGNFYGVYDAASTRNGYLFRMTTSGIATVLYTLPENYEFSTALTQDKTGAFYGTSGYGLFTFGPDGTSSVFPDIGFISPLVLASDGNLYGTGFDGIYQLQPNGTNTEIFSYDCTAPNCTTQYPYGVATSMPLLQGSQGAIYFESTEYASVPPDYLLDIQPPDAPLPPPVQISVTPSRLAIGQTGTLKWTVNTAINASYPICFATGNVPGWTGRQPTSGSITGSISTAGVYSVALTCGGTESGTASVVVSKNIADTVTLSASPNPVAEGSTTTLKAVVQAQSGPGPTGPVSFYYGSDLLGTGTLVNGTATLTASSTGIPPGNYSLVAKYGGDVNYALGASPSYTVSVTPAQ